MEQVEGLINKTGYEEVSLTSLSICDYSDIENLVQGMIMKYKDQNVGISLPSLRIDSFSVDLINEIQKVRKSGLTFAPEAGSQRMRDVINKGVSEEDLINSVSSAFNAGWSTIKLYFMIGLPYEDIEDVKGIGYLAEKVVSEYFKVPKEKRNKGLKVTVSSSIFVPKPFTPFQWAPQDDVETMRTKISAIRGTIKSRSINYNWHESQVSFLEAIFARGDRRLCDVLVSAFKKGAKFDGWSEYFNQSYWEEALKECGVDGGFYTYRNRSYEEILPWDFIDIGVDKEFLIKENEKAKTASLTPDCRLGCTKCGVNVNFREGKCFEGALFNKVQ
jgi:radical SAM family uncharacterized protein